MSTNTTIPISWDNENDKKLFGDLFPSGLSANSLPYNKNNSLENLEANKRDEFVSPFLKQYLREDGVPVKLDSSVSAFNHKDSYNVNYIYFEKGSSMLDYYNNKSPDKNEMWVLYEEDNPKKSNLFGSFVLVKMGDGYYEMLKNLKNKQTTLFSHIGNNTSGYRIDSFEKELQDDYNRLLKSTKNISKEKFRFALETEMRINSDGGKLIGSIFGGFDTIVADVTEVINKAIEDVKFTKDDYTPQEKDKDLSLDYFIDQFIEINKELATTIADYAIPDVIEKKLTTAFTSFTTNLTKLAKENLPKETLAFFEKAYTTFKEIVAFFKETAQYFKSLAGDALYLLEAFLMGIVNGLLSTIQMIITVIGWLLKTNTDKKLTGQYYLELQSKFEFIEDLLDLVSETAVSVFNSINALRKDFSLEKLKELLSLFKGKASQIDRFDTAYFIGNFIFEVVLGVILTFFTGGAAAVAEAANAAEKATAFLKIFAREMISTATMGIVDILQLFKTLILKFVNACKTGWKGFKAFIEKLLLGKVDEVIPKPTVIEDVVIPSKKRQTAAEERVLAKKEAKLVEKEHGKILRNKTIEGNPVPSYEKGFEHYEARTPKLSEIPIHLRRQANLLTHKIDKEIANLLDVNNTSGLSKGKKILLDKKGKKFIQEKWLVDRQLVAGMIHQDKKLGEIIISKTNFPKGELNDFIKLKGIGRGESNLGEIKEIYKFYKQQGHIKFGMHPYIEELLKNHFDEVAKGIKHPPSYNWERTGGLPGTHAEVLALNDLLWTLEKKGVKINEEVLKGLIGYNKNILKEEYMIRCGDCQLILKDVVFLEKITKFN